MNIRVDLSYEGSEGRIERGLYAINDERLLGLTDLLIANGHAVVIESDYAIGVDPAIPEKDTTIETLVELSHDVPTVPTVKPKSKR